ncbi:MAG TPA: sirohydrochlorin cobaltochelatase [Desulfobacterales bacterium]|nr:sirohydrochlorin cobaltochelatase [Desulfobacterales bacterium]
MQTPIVLTAFGTTTNAFKTYDFVDTIIREEFPGHEILWAFSSRMVLDRLRHGRKFEVRHPHEVLQALSDKGYSWAVIQSMHLLCGHEFYRLLEEVKPLAIRTSIGLPLLSSYEDYRQLAKSFDFKNNLSEGEAPVLVGHGTDHPSWAAYPTLESILREVHGSDLYVGVVEGYPSLKQVLEAVTAAKFRKVRLIPLMLVAGAHFYEDLCEGEDSWKTAFEGAGLEVNVEAQGIGFRKEVIRVFIGHIRDALDAIPASNSLATRVLKNQQPENLGSVRVSGENG